MREDIKHIFDKYAPKWLIRQAIMIDNLRGFIKKKYLKNVFNFTRTKTPDNCVLIIECNQYHGVTLQSLVCYFHRLGINVELLVHPAIIESQALGALRGVKCWPIWYKLLCLKKYQSKLDSYDYIFVNTSNIYKYENLLHSLGKRVPRKNNVFAYVHAADEMQRNSIYDYIDRKRLFKLSSMLGEIDVENFISPILFYGNKPKRKRNTEKTRFISVGNIRTKTKDMDLLLHAVSLLASQGEKSFEVNIVGDLGSSYARKIRKKAKTLGIADFFIWHGSVDYIKLEELCFSCDFILSLLNEKLHSDYIDKKTSGTNLLAYGYCIPPIIEHSFSKFFPSAEKCTISYETCLATAMKEAIDMSAERYDSLVVCIDAMAKQQQEESLANLKKAIAF